MPTIDSREQGPTWNDVTTTMQEVGDAHKGHVSITAGVSGTRRVGLTLEVALWRTSGRERPYIAALVRGYWPDRNHRTMPGLLYKLLLNLDTEYERRLAFPPSEMPEAELPSPPLSAR